MKYYILFFCTFLLFSCKKEDKPTPSVEEYEAPVSIPKFSQRNKTVSPDASGGGNGSDESPWTLNEAMKYAQAGDTVGIRAGLYVGSNNVTESQARYSPAFKPANSGTEDAPIIFVAEYQASKVSTGYTEIRSGATETGSGWPAFGILSKEYVYWVGIYSTEKASDNKGVADSGPCTVWSSKGSKILGCRIKGEAVDYIDNHSAIRLETSTELTISDNDLSGFNQNSVNSVNQTGITTYYVTFTAIEHNTIHNCGSAIQLKGGEHYGLYIRFNVFYENLFSTIRAHGFAKGPNNERSRIYQNLFFNNQIELELTSSGSIGVLGVEAMDFFNNSVYVENGSLGYSFLLITDGIEQHDNRIFNNAIYTNGRASYYMNESNSYSAEIFADYVQTDMNCYFSANSFGKGTSSSNWSNINMTDWQSLTGQDKNSILSDPLFTDLSATGLKLDQESPCFNAGKDKGQLLGTDSDAAINIGAYITKEQSEQFGVRN